MKKSGRIEHVLVANRGEIAIRVMRTLAEMGIRSTAVASDPDREALHVLSADHVVFIGGETPGESYLDQGKILSAAKEVGADAIHPGYGFLSENASFARAVADAGLIWIGPPAAAIESMGDKLVARATMEKADVPVVPGSPVLTEVDAARQAAEDIGYPVMLKAAAGGGGKGMRVVHEATEIAAAFAAARRESQGAFGSDEVFVEKFIERPRHIEFQVLADSHGNTVHLFERECSIQRRHQKIVEETPSPALDEHLREKMGQAAVEATRAANYVNAGTVEFILAQDGEFFFLEMNTRLQVEHPITEMTCGIDLVRHQIEIARGEELPWQQEDISRRGHAIECRIYAEDPANNFFPSSGKIKALATPTGPGVRDDTGIYEGAEVSTFYDPMLSKLVVFGEDRKAATERMVEALGAYQVLGLCTTIPFLLDVLKHEAFAAGDTCTDFIPKYMDGWEPDSEGAAMAALLAAFAGPAGRGGRTGGKRPAEAFNVWQEVGRRGK